MMEDAGIERTKPNRVSFTQELDLFLQEQKVNHEQNDRNTVIKCTRLAEYNNKPYLRKLHHSPPRFRAFATIQDDGIKSPRSLKTGIGGTGIAAITMHNTRRKIATIAEDVENDLHPRFSSRKDKSGRGTNAPQSFRASAIPQSAKSLPAKQYTHKNNVQCMRFQQPRPPNAKVNNTEANKKPLVQQRVRTSRSPTSYNGDPIPCKNNRDSSRELGGRMSYHNNSKKSNLTRTNSTEKISYIKNALISRSSFTSPSRSDGVQSAASREQVKAINYPHHIIHVPLAKKLKTKNKRTEIIEPVNVEPAVNKVKLFRDCFSLTEYSFRDAGITTEPATLCDIAVGTKNEEDKQTQNESTVSIECQTDKHFDSLDVPSISLINKTYIDEVLENITSKNVKIHSSSRSVPSFYVTPVEEEQLLKSYIVGRATLTYMTKQSINFHLVDDTDLNPSQLTPIKCPLNIVSIYKNELKKRDSIQSVKSNISDKVFDVQSKTSRSFKLEQNRKEVTPFKTDKLIKPSDVIRTIKINSDLLPNHFMTEQFQKELNFIDSFFESLQYLENCSLSDKVTDLDKKAQSSYEIDNTEYSKFLSKLENGSDSEDSDTMASKSLCLLNLLIRDEQRRAKNLLLVLKMREDALKDFTKSQIIWLENRKKRDHTDISALKKKQRGALLRLQHECGEMQRMRKALLALSEKRKSALLKTKKSIEQKLNTNIDIDKLLTNKKKRNTLPDIPKSPIKCFDLSSSNEDSNHSLVQKSIEKTVVPSDKVSIKPAMSEKSMQTSDPLNSSVSDSTIVAPENFVVVDGRYLNILFQTIALPQIFHVGKQYEVKEEALQAILNNSQTKLTQSDVLMKFVEQVCKEKSSGGKSSTPSTARSLVEELDQYYKDANKELDLYYKDDNKTTSLEDEDYDSGNKVYDISEFEMQSDTQEDTNTKVLDAQLLKGTSTCGVSLQIDITKRIENEVAAGPLPVPPGAPTETTGDSMDWQSKESSYSFTSTEKSELSSLETAPISLSSSHVDYEAERLRQQQLAIEREIKALEEQQCLLVVREIPDKPPPPYTPPTDARQTSLSFTAEAITQQAILDSLKRRLRGQSPREEELPDPFEIFVQDYCSEVAESLKVQCSEDPWDACNLMPQKQELDLDALAKKTYSDLQEVLSATPPPPLSGMSIRRGEQSIDDNNAILSEWRRSELEWTALHVDELAVKNRIFENIFQKILSETVDEYKKFFT